MERTRVSCDVKNCQYNTEGKYCGADEISVMPQSKAPTSNYDTNCSTFISKNSYT